MIGCQDALPVLSVKSRHSGLPPLYLLPFVSLMGRPPWATPEQTAFLESFVPGLDLAKKTHGLQTEYQRIARDFIQKWPTEPTTEEQKLPDDPQVHANARRGRVSEYLS